MAGPADYQRWHSALLWGIVELDETDVQHVCGGRPASAIYDHQDVLNWLITGLTGGIYQASTVRVWCADQASAALPAQQGELLAGEGPKDVLISADGTARWVAAPDPDEARAVAWREADGAWQLPSQP